MFIGSAGINSSIGHISYGKDTEYDNKHPITLDTCHFLVGLIMRHSQIKPFHQACDDMGAIILFKFAVLKLRWLLRNIKKNC